MAGDGPAAGPGDVTGAEFALLDKNRKPLIVTSKDKGGKPSFYDKIKSKWRDALGDTPYTVKDFRDFGSLLLQNSKYRVYRVAWLGHTPKEVHEKHYSGEGDVTEACRWLLERITELTEPPQSKEGKALVSSGSVGDSQPPAVPELEVSSAKVLS